MLGGISVLQEGYDSKKSSFGRPRKRKTVIVVHCHYIFRLHVLACLHGALLYALCIVFSNRQTEKVTCLYACAQATNSSSFDKSATQHACAASKAPYLCGSMRLHHASCIHAIPQKSANCKCNNSASASPGKLATSGAAA